MTDILNPIVSTNPLADRLFRHPQGRALAESTRATASHLLAMGMVAAVLAETLPGEPSEDAHKTATDAALMATTRPIAHCIVSMLNDDATDDAFEDLMDDLFSDIVDSVRAMRRQLATGHNPGLSSAVSDTRELATSVAAAYLAHAEHHTPPSPDDEQPGSTVH